MAEEIVQQPYNLFAQQKRAGYPGAVQQAEQEQVVVAKPQPTEKTAGTMNKQVQGGAYGAMQGAGQGAAGVQPTIASMEDLAKAMGYTSPEEEERLRKASVANQRILAVGDALRHIGNIANTVNYAPAQQFNKPWEEEEARYKQGKALRDKANLTYLNYQQAKAAQDAKQRQWAAEQDYKNSMLSHYQDQDRRLWERDAETAVYHEGLLGLRKEKQKLDDDYRNKRISIDEYNARSRRISAMASAARAGGSSRGGGKGMDEYTVTSDTQYTFDNQGNKTGSKTTKTRTVNGKKQPTQTTTKKKLPGQENTGKKKLP